MIKKNPPYQLSFHLDDGHNWLQTINQHLPSDLENDILKFDPDFGEGTIHLKRLQNGLKISFIDIQVYEDVLINQISTAENDCFILDFHKSNFNFSAFVGDKEHIFGMEDQSVSFVSSMSNISYKIPKNQHIKYVHLFVNQKWLSENILEEKTNLFIMVMGKEPLRIFEHLDYKLSKMLDLNPQSSKVDMLSTIYNTFSHLVNKLESRKKMSFSNVSGQDLNTLIKARTQIERAVPEMHSNADLASTCHMSLSKFMRLFKQVFGITPYQYHLDIKMDRAMQLVQNNRLSVKEICNVLNYQSPGNFTKIFQKKYGIRPQDVHMNV